MSIISAGLVVIILLVVIGGCISGAEMFNAKKYQKLVEVEETTEKEFNEDIEFVSEDTEPIIVTLSTAQKLGDRTVGAIENSSWYEVDDEYNLIKYKDELYRISPLNYADIFKFNEAKYAGIPGYVLVNAKTQEAEYVDLKEPIRYSPSASFSYQLKRHLRSLYPSYMFGSSFFEIDEEGNPYYIISVRNKSIGMFGGEKEETFIVMNASTGEVKEYEAKDLPEWIDHAYGINYMMTVTNYNFKYKLGWRNSRFAKTGVYKTSTEYGSDYYNTAITAKGEVVFYTGVTPANSAESNIGFVLANPRTGKITFYKCDGAEETSAMGAAEGQVSDFGYTATFPTIYNVDGNPSYFMLLRDNAGTVQRYAFCNLKNYTEVVQADTFEGALELYREKIGTKKAPEPEKVEILKAEGKIANLYQTQIDGSTHYCFTLEGSKNFYVSSIKNDYQQVMLKEGSTVSIEYKNSKDGIFIVTKIQF